jgi:hypothetical protein
VQAAETTSQLMVIFGCSSIKQAADLHPRGKSTTHPDSSMHLISGEDNP